VNKCLEGYLVALYLINKHNGSSGYLWLNGGITLPSILQAKMTPFMALYGYHPPSITSSLRENSKVQAVEDHIEHQQQVLQLLKDNLTLGTE
jgi:allophanate hydrolase subunit 2